MARYEVICGNIGTVHTGDNPVEARKHYGEYKRQSESGVGRAGDESVYLMKDGEIELEHVGPVDMEDDDDEYEPEFDGQPDEAQEWHDFDPDC